MVPDSTNSLSNTQRIAACSSVSSTFTCSRASFTVIGTTVSVSMSVHVTAMRFQLPVAVAGGLSSAM